MINQLQYFFGVKGQVALDWNPGPGYNTLLLRLIPRDLYSVCPHRLFLTLPGLSDSQAALLNPNACVLRREGICTIFVMVFNHDLPGTRTHDWPRSCNSLANQDGEYNLQSYMQAYLCIYKTGNPIYFSEE